MLEQSRFTYFHLGKTFGKQIKTIEDQGKKQVKTLKVLKQEEQVLKSIERMFPKDLENNRINKEGREIKEREDT